MIKIKKIRGFTCIECGHLYSDIDGDTDERTCNNCTEKGDSN